MKVQVLSNVLVLQSTAFQERGRVDRSRRDNNLGSPDGELASVLSTNNSNSLALLDQDAINKGILHELGAMLLCVCQEGHHCSLLFSESAAESAPSARVLLTARVLGDVLGGVSELTAAFQQERVSGVVLDVFVRDIEAGGDGVNGFLVGGGVEVRKSLLGPLFANIVGELKK